MTKNRCRLMSRSDLELIQNRGYLKYLKENQLSNWYLDLLHEIWMALNSEAGTSYSSYGSAYQH